MSYAILDRILQKLKDLGMSPRDASISSGHSADLIRNWQRAQREGRPFPGKAHMLASLAPVLGVTPEWLMQGDLREMAEDAEPFAMPEDICTPAMLSRIAPGARHLQTFVSSTSAAFIGVLAGDVLLVDLGATPAVGQSSLITRDSDAGTARTVVARCFGAWFATGDPGNDPIPQADVRHAWPIVGLLRGGGLMPDSIED